MFILLHWWNNILMCKKRPPTPTFVGVLLRGLECKLPNQSIMFTPNVQAFLEWICNNYSVATPNEWERWATNEVKVDVALDNFSCEFFVIINKVNDYPIVHWYCESKMRVLLWNWSTFLIVHIIYVCDYRK